MSKLEAESFSSLYEYNRRWFDQHKHLSNEEMLEAGLIDKCDIVWIEAMRILNG